MNVYEIVTERIVSLLVRGVVPWRKPWPAELAPRNLVTKRPYRGVNVLLLESAGYGSPYWLTYRQAKELGGQVRRGERSMPVVFWKWLGNGPEADDEAASAADGKPIGVRSGHPMLRYYSVFNVQQCDGLADRIPAPMARPADFSPIAEAERIVADMPNRPPIRHGCAGCWYRPGTDEVGMVNAELFTPREEYYAALFHELTHSTAHTSRLGRKQTNMANRFGSDAYGREELVAEVGAAFLCGESGIAPAIIENAAAYVANWLKAIKSDPRAVVIAAAQAHKAADYILARQAASVPAEPVADAA